MDGWWGSQSIFFFGHENPPHKHALTSWSGRQQRFHPPQPPNTHKKIAVAIVIIFAFSVTSIDFFFFFFTPVCLTKTVFFLRVDRGKPLAVCVAKILPAKSDESTTSLTGWWMFGLGGLAVWGVGVGMARGGEEMEIYRQDESSEAFVMHYGCGWLGVLEFYSCQYGNLRVRWQG